MTTPAITIDDFVVFCERTIDGMVATAASLTEAQLNLVPALPDANTAYQLINHALSACGWWVGHVVCSEVVERDRPGEFTSAGTIDDLHLQADALKAALVRLTPAMETATGLHIVPTLTHPLEGEWTVGRALIHAYEELAQHRGHLDITADLVRVGQL